MQVCMTYEISSSLRCQSQGFAAIHLMLVARPLLGALPATLAARLQWRRSATGMFAGPGSDQLRGKSCAELGGCSRDTPEVSKEQLPELLAAVPSWQLSEEGGSISKALVAKNFKAAIAFVNQVADVAEAEGHHPDIHLTDYRDVRLVLSTHAIGGRLTVPDFVVAAKIDALPVDCSPKWLRQQQAEQQQKQEQQQQIQQEQEQPQK